MRQPVLLVQDEQKLKSVIDTYIKLSREAVDLTASTQAQDWE